MAIKVKDLVEYLQRVDPEKEVYLDKDGWMEDETGHANPTPRQIIAARGLFWDGKTCLIINN